MFCIAYLEYTNFYSNVHILCMYVYWMNCSAQPSLISLNTMELISRDWPGKLWLPDFLYFKQHLKTESVYFSAFIMP